MNGIPKKISSKGGFIAVVTSSNEVLVRKQDATLASLKPEFTASAVAFSLDAKELAIGSTDGKVQFYSWDGKALTLASTAEKNRGEVTCIAYSPNNQMVAIADTQRAVMVYDTSSKEV
jgi:WD40 repeat protein